MDGDVVVSVTAVAVAVGLLVWNYAAQLVGWWTPSGLTVGELARMARLEDPVAPLMTFYGWRQDAWRQLGRGAAAAAVTLVVALVGLTLDAAKTVTEVDGSAHSEAKVTTTSADAPEPVFALIGALMVIAVVAWLQALHLQRRCTRDIEALP